MVLHRLHGVVQLIWRADELPRSASSHLIYIQCQPLISNLQKRAKRWQAGQNRNRTQKQHYPVNISNIQKLYKVTSCLKLKKSSQNLFARDTGGKAKAGLSLFIDKDNFQRSNMICKTSQECETALMSQFAGFKELFGERESFKEVSVFSWESFGHGCCPLVIIWAMVFNYPGPGLDYILRESAPDLELLEK